MNLRSLGYFTDISMLQFGGRVEDRPEYVVAETPDNPSYFWGNLLVMRQPPQSGDFPKWSQLFQREFAHQSLVEHMTFGWDSFTGEEGNVKEFLEQGFQLEHSVILTARQENLRAPPHPNERAEVRALQSDSEWEAAFQNQISAKLADFKEELYIPFKRKQMQRYRRMAEAGLGHWYGAFLGGKLVADCGLFIFSGTGRYQAVVTHPDFRRQGLCGKLIYESAQAAFGQQLAITLVMAADPEYHAAKVYEAVGFRPTERQVGICRFPQEGWKKNS